MSARSAVGRRLKEERERRGLQLVDVSRATAIYAHHLVAIEFGRFDELPDVGEAEAAVRAYAEHLGLDGPSTVVELRIERGVAGPDPIAPQPAREPTTRRRALRVVGTIAGILALAAIAAWWTAEREPARDPETPILPIAPPPENPVEEDPPVAQEPRPAPATPGSSLIVPEHGIGAAVVDHELVGPSDRFVEGDTVWFWTRVEGGKPGDSVNHVWIREGREVLVVPLGIGGARWRTQSSRFLGPGSAGDWTVEARDEDGKILARDTFRCRKGSGLEMGHTDNSARSSRPPDRGSSWPRSRTPRRAPPPTSPNRRGVWGSRIPSRSGSRRSRSPSFRRPRAPTPVSG